MDFLLFILGWVLLPYAVLVMLPGWTSLGLACFALAAGVLWAFGAAIEAGPDGFPLLYLSMLVTGTLSGVATGSVMIILRQRLAPWHARALVIGVGVLACAPIWIFVLLGLGLLLAHLRAWG